MKLKKMTSIFEFINKVAQMRSKQKACADSRDPISRNEARKAEKEVDEWLKETGLTEEKKQIIKNQPTLFQ
jgi:hypothetical protein